MLVIVPLVMAVVVVEDTVGIPVDHLTERLVTTAAAVDILLENAVNLIKHAILAENPAILVVIALKEEAAAVVLVVEEIER